MSYLQTEVNIFISEVPTMKRIRIKGKLSLVWLLALAVLLYTGINLVCEAREQQNKSAEVFAGGGVYQKPNASLKDLLE